MAIMKKINKSFHTILLVVVTILSTSCLTTAQELSRNESSQFPLRPSLAAKQLQGVSGSDTCSLSEALSAIRDMFQQFLKEEVEDEFTCDNAVLGKFRHCPAPNCSQIFSISQTLHFPGYYWITAENDSTIQVYCDFEAEQFPYTTAEIEDIANDTCPTTEQRMFVQEKIQLHDYLSQISSNLVTCTSQIIGLVAHCPANSCSQVFDIIHDEFLRLSNYYWLRSTDGDVTEVYCNRSTMQPEYSSCQQLFEFETIPSGTYTIRIQDGTYLEVYCNNETGQGGYNSCAEVNLLNLPSGTYTLRLSDGTYSEVYCNNETGQGEYDSCAHASLFGLPSGTYTIRPSDGSPVTLYCDMNNEECGGGAWVRVASYNYSDPSSTCPGDWNLITSPIRACGANQGPGCSSALFPTNGIEFSSVCGRVITIQYGTPDAFFPYHNLNQISVDDYYVDGVSITYGNPRQHVWTFVGYPSDEYTNSVASLCPCSQPSLSIPSPPHFVGNNYFCDTGASTGASTYYLDDPLWDGEGCDDPSTCCSFNNPPWFSTALPETTADDIEVRICFDLGSLYENLLIIRLDLHIQ